LFVEFRRLETGTRDELRRFEKIPLPRFFKYLPFWLLTILLPLAFAASVPLLHHRDSTPMPGEDERGAGCGWVGLLVIHQLGKRPAGPVASTIAGNLARARLLHDRSLEQAELRHQQEQERIQKEFETTSRSLNQEWKQAMKEVMGTRGVRAQKVDEKGARVLLANELTHRAKLQQIESSHADNVARLQRESEARQKNWPVFTRRKW